MDIFHALPNPPLAQPSALTIGNFDGVHRGHQSLIQAMMEDAHHREWLAGVPTFHPHPSTVLRPTARHSYLTTLQERLDLLEDLGLDFAVVYPFGPATASTPAQEFVSNLRQTLRLAALWVGPDFALGRHREGNVPFLTTLGSEMGFEVHVIGPQTLLGDEVRSGRIRSFLQRGEVAQAADQLGRSYALSGTVVKGATRGRSIGFPTANLDVPAGRLLPANGVYATWAVVDAGDAAQPLRRASVTNIGVRPSFDNGQQTVETHLLDFEDDLYGKRVTREFVAPLRPEMRFPSVDALRSQIARDVEQARLLLSGQA